MSQETQRRPSITNHTIITHGPHSPGAQQPSRVTPLSPYHRQRVLGALQDMEAYHKIQQQSGSSEGSGLTGSGPGSPPQSVKALQQILNQGGPMKQVVTSTLRSGMGLTPVELQLKKANNSHYSTNYLFNNTALASNLNKQNLIHNNSTSVQSSKQSQSQGQQLDSHRSLSQDSNTNNYRSKNPMAQMSPKLQELLRRQAETVDSNNTPGSARSGAQTQTRKNQQNIKTNSNSNGGGGPVQLFSGGPTIGSGDQPAHYMTAKTSGDNERLQQLNRMTQEKRAQEIHRMRQEMNQIQQERKMQKKNNFKSATSSATTSTGTQSYLQQTTSIQQSQVQSSNYRTVLSNASTAASRSRNSQIASGPPVQPFASDRASLPSSGMKFGKTNNNDQDLILNRSSSQTSQSGPGSGPSPGPGSGGPPGSSSATVSEVLQQIQYEQFQSSAKLSPMASNAASSVARKQILMNLIKEEDPSDDLLQNSQGGGGGAGVVAASNLNNSRGPGSEQNQQQQTQRSSSSSSMRASAVTAGTSNQNLEARKQQAENSYIRRLSRNRDGYRPLGSSFDYIKFEKKEQREKCKLHQCF